MVIEGVGLSLLNEADADRRQFGASSALMNVVDSDLFFLTHSTGSPYTSRMNGAFYLDTTFPAWQYGGLCSRTRHVSNRNRSTVGALCIELRMFAYEHRSYSNRTWSIYATLAAASRCPYCSEAQLRVWHNRSSVILRLFYYVWPRDLQNLERKVYQC